MLLAIGRLWLDLSPTSFPAPVTTLLSLLLAAGTGVLGVGIGERLLALLGIQSASDGERLVLAGALGLGALAYGFLALGLIGLLRAPAIIVMVTFSSIAAWPSLRHYPMYWRKLWSALERQDFFGRIAITLVVAMLVLVLLRGLAPVIDYDGLMYHLVVPRDYWEAGRISPYPGESHGNFPLTVDLLYIPAVILGLESAAKLIHLGFGVLMGLGVYAAAKRVLGLTRGGWLAVFVLATTPVLGTVGGYAYTDMGWALFAFLSVFALLRWREEGKRRWLVLGGVFVGLCLGSKYLGLPVLGVLGLVVLVQSGLLRSGNRGLLDRKSWERMLTDGLIFGVVAIAVASPWYVKNWLWLGNPFYPLWFGGRNWDAYQAVNLAHLGTRYGPRDGLLGVLLLPWDLFVRSIGHFGSIPFAFPPPPSLLLPLYLLIRRRGTVNLILLIAALRFVTWAVSARNARFLMDIFPLLSIAVAYLLMELSRRHLFQLMLQGVLFLLLVANLVWQSALFFQEDPIPVVLGVESREEYLVDHNDPPYRAIRFINRLPPDSKVFFVGGGQSYYVTTDHVADIAHANWGHLVYRHGERPEQLHRVLLSQGFTHILYSGYDFEWHLNFDNDGHIAQELDLFEEFTARCARLVYSAGEDVEVYALSDACEPDPLLDRWLHTIHVYGRDPDAIADVWRAEGITHVLLHRAGLNHVLDGELDPITSEDLETLDALTANHLTLTKDFASVYELYSLEGRP
jgi:hypothetical protein